MIGIIGAMEEEIAELRGRMTDVSEECAAGMTFYRGRLLGKDAVVVVSGIGKVNAAVCAELLAERFHADCIINTGIAGALAPEVKIGDIVLSTDAVQYDMDARGFGYALGQIPRMDVLAFPADEGLIGAAEKAAREVLPDVGLFRGRVASGDRFVSDGALKDKIVRDFGAYCCEMEGAAILQASYLNGIPCLIIRVMSDQADGSAPAQYDSFQEEAIRRLSALTAAMVSGTDL